jgi:hypothetical protein
LGWRALGRVQLTGLAGAGGVAVLVAVLLLVGFEYRVRLPFDVRQIVEQPQSYGDHHSVLKNILRLGVQDELRPQVETSIAAIGQRAPKEAEAWLRKLR